MDGKGKASRLLIMCGLPGSGKSTLARQLEVKHQAIRFTPDDWMLAFSLDIYDGKRRENIEALQWKLARDLLAHGLTVIIDWGSWGRDERDILRLGARALGAAVELHYLSAPPAILFERIQRRGREVPPIKREDLLKWCALFQTPTAEELALFDAPK